MVKTDRETIAQFCKTQEICMDCVLFGEAYVCRSPESMTDSEVEAACMAIIETIKEMPKVGEWIPCSERLPEKNGIYIVDDRAFNSPWIHTAGFEVSSQAWCENHGVYYDDKYGRYEDGRVTAWQPLPEPWEGEGDV